MTQAERLALTHARGLIDGIDDGLVALLAARHRLVWMAGRLKQRLGVPVRDPAREQRVHARAARLSRHLGMPEDVTHRLLDAVIGEACRLQQGPDGPPRLLPPAENLHMNPQPDPAAAPPAPAMRWLRVLPPPQRLAPVVKIVPRRWQARLLESALARVLGSAVHDGSLDFMHGRRIGIEVSDLRMRWVLALVDGRLRLVEGEPEASVRGTATDLLLLASRLEDADTLFFQRALVLTGDTELGLTARNLLDRLPWESVPLGFRILLHRGARLAHAARASYRAAHG